MSEEVENLNIAEYFILNFRITMEKLVGKICISYLIRIEEELETLRGRREG
jgi:hypothetical protein